MDEQGRGGEPPKRLEQKRCRAIIEQTSEGILVFDGDSGRVLEPNAALGRLLGYSTEEFLEMTIHDFIENDHESTDADARKHLEEGQISLGKRRYRRKDGSFVGVEVVVSSISYADRAELCALIRGMRARKWAEEALLQKRERIFGSLADSILSIVIAEPDGTQRNVSPSLERLLGYQPGDRVGRSIFERIHPDDAEHARQSFATVLDEYGASLTMEFRDLHLDGSYRHVEANVYNLLDDPDVGGVVCNYLDVTDRNVAERERLRVEERHRRIFENSPQGIFQTTRDGHLVETNSTLAVMFGYESSEELLSDISCTDDHLYVDLEDRATFTEAVQRLGVVSAFELPVRRRDGERRWMSVSARALRGTDGKITGYEGTMEDTTERKNVDAELRRTLDRLLAIREAGQLLTSTLDAEKIAIGLLEIMQRISGLTATVISMRSDDGEAYIWHAVGLEGLWRRARFMPEAETARQAVLESGEQQLFWLHRPGEEIEYLAVLCLPLRVNDRVVGVLEAYGPESLEDQPTMNMMSGLTAQAGSALQNATLYQELADRERQLSNMVNKLLLAQEEERRRVSYEVHDGLTQIAVSAYQYLQALQSYPADSVQGRQILEKSIELIQRTIDESRRLIADLRPTALDDFGLGAALRLQAERLRTEDRTIDYQNRIGDQRLSASVETVLYRVAQEALTNVRKHAGSCKVLMEVGLDQESAWLRIRDWGIGFRLDELYAAGPGERVGISGMRERVSMVGGHLEVYSEPGAGTSLFAQVPLKQPRTGTADRIVSDSDVDA